MFGKRAGVGADQNGGAGLSPKPTMPVLTAPTLVPARSPEASRPLEPGRSPAAPPPEARRSERFYEVKSQIFDALIEAIDLTQLAKLDGESAREEIRDIVAEIIAIKNIVMSIAEQEDLLDRHLQRRAGLRPARAAAGARRHRRHHGQRRRYRLHRGRAARFSAPTSASATISS